MDELRNRIVNEIYDLTAEDIQTINYDESLIALLRESHSIDETYNFLNYMAMNNNIGYGLVVSLLVKAYSFKEYILHEYKHQYFSLETLKDTYRTYIGELDDDIIKMIEEFHQEYYIEEKHFELKGLANSELVSAIHEGKLLFVIKELRLSQIDDDTKDYLRNMPDKTLDLSEMTVDFDDLKLLKNLGFQFDKVKKVYLRYNIDYDEFIEYVVNHPDFANYNYEYTSHSSDINKERLIEIIRSKVLPISFVNGLIQSAPVGDDVIHEVIMNYPHDQIESFHSYSDRVNNELLLIKTIKDKEVLDKALEIFNDRHNLIFVLDYLISINYDVPTVFKIVSGSLDEDIPQSVFDYIAKYVESSVSQYVDSLENSENVDLAIYNSLDINPTGKKIVITSVHDLYNVYKKPGFFENNTFDVSGIFSRCKIGDYFSLSSFSKGKPYQKLIEMIRSKLLPEELVKEIIILAQKEFSESYFSTANIAKLELESYIVYGHLINSGDKDKYYNLFNILIDLGLMDKFVNQNVIIDHQIQRKDIFEFLANNIDSVDLDTFINKIAKECDYDTPESLLVRALEKFGLKTVITYAANDLSIYSRIMNISKFQKILLEHRDEIMQLINDDHTFEYKTAFSLSEKLYALDVIGKSGIKHHELKHALDNPEEEPITRIRAFLIDFNDSQIRRKIAKFLINMRQLENSNIKEIDQKMFDYIIKMFYDSSFDISNYINYIDKLEISDDDKKELKFVFREKFLFFICEGYDFYLSSLASQNIDKDEVSVMYGFEETNNKKIIKAWLCKNSNDVQGVRKIWDVVKKYFPDMSVEVFIVLVKFLSNNRNEFLRKKLEEYHVPISDANKLVSTLAADQLLVDEIMRMEAVRKERDDITVSLSSKKAKKVDSNNMLEIIEALKKLGFDIYNSTELLDTVLNDKLVYNRLLKIIRKVKIDLIPDDAFKVISEKLGFMITINKSSIIKQLQNLSDEEVDDIITALKATYKISVNSEVYTAIFGREDCELIVTDPDLNSSNKDPNIRLDSCVELYQALYSKRTMNIPALRKEYELPTGEKMKITVGNFTNPRNLTYGERTGACMRAYGIGFGLMLNTVYHENGFNIDFSDPNGKFVSRVTGFRLGNTLYLNELRDSVDDNYTNADLREFCKMVAEDLVMLTKDSPYPIENVIIKKMYSFKDTNLPTPKMDTEEYPLVLPGYPSVTFRGIEYRMYSDVGTIRSEDGVLFPKGGEQLHIDQKSPMPQYPVLRSEKRILGVNANQEQCNEIIKRVDMLSHIFNGEDYHYVDIPENYDIIYGEFNDDYYVFVDSDNNLHYAIIETNEDGKKVILGGEEARAEYEESLLSVRGLIEERERGINL